MRQSKLLLSAILALGASVAMAAETAPAKGPVATATPAKPDKSAAKDDTAAPTGKPGLESASQAAAKSVDKAGTPQRFIPSEQVRADFDVSFPIDI